LGVFIIQETRERREKRERERKHRTDKREESRRRRAAPVNVKMDFAFFFSNQLYIIFKPKHP